MEQFVDCLVEMPFRTGLFLALMFCGDFETNGTGVTKDEAKRNAVVNWNKMMKEITA